MTYSIIGSGKIGRALARQFARRDISVRVANSRGAEAVAPLREEFGDSIVPSSVDEALAADVVVMAVPFAAVGDIGGRAGDWRGRILVDATNAINFTDFTPIDLGGKPSTEVIAEALPTARVVKGFNTLPAALLEADPADDGGRRVIFLSGNAADARSEVAQLADKLGFAAIDLGRTDEGGRLAQFGGPLVLQNLTNRSPARA